MSGRMQFLRSITRPPARRTRGPIAVLGMLTVAAAAIHAPAPAEAMWCATYGSGIRSCSFHTQAQCQASISGLGGFCSELPGSRSANRPPPEPRQKAAPEPKKRPPPNVKMVPERPAAASASVAAASSVQSGPMRSREFLAARQLILNGQYEPGIAAMRALKQDSHPDVAVYVGLAHAGLNRADEAKSWYARALAADENHRLTLALDGIRRVEAGDLSGARDHLVRIEKACGGTTCTEYQNLQKVLASTVR